MKEFQKYWIYDLLIKEEAKISLMNLQGWITNPPVSDCWASASNEYGIRHTVSEVMTLCKWNILMINILYFLCELAGTTSSNSLSETVGHSHWILPSRKLLSTTFYHFYSHATQLYTLLCPSVYPSVCWSIKFYLFFMIFTLRPHCSCPNGLHRTGVAVYPVLFIFLN